MLDEILKVWPILIGVGGTIAWLVRLESKVNYSSKTIETLQGDREHLSKIEKELAAIKNDIKWIKQYAQDALGKKLTL